MIDGVRVRRDWPAPQSPSEAWSPLPAVGRRDVPFGEVCLLSFRQMEEVTGRHSAPPRTSLTVRFCLLSQGELGAPGPLGVSGLVVSSH